MNESLGRIACKSECKLIKFSWLGWKCLERRWNHWRYQNMKMVIYFKAFVCENEKFLLCRYLFTFVVHPFFKWDLYFSISDDWLFMSPCHSITNSMVGWIFLRSINISLWLFFCMFEVAWIIFQLIFALIFLSFHLAIYHMSQRALKFVTKVFSSSTNR